MLWIFLGLVYVSFQLPPNQTLTVAFIPYRCLNNWLPFSVYSYLQERWLLATSTHGTDPTQVPGDLSLPPLPSSTGSSCDPPPHSDVPAWLPPALQPGVSPKRRPVEERTPHRVGQGLLAAIPPLLPQAASSLEGILALQRPPRAFPTPVSSLGVRPSPVSGLTSRETEARSSARLWGFHFSWQCRAAAFLSKMGQITS